MSEALLQTQPGRAPVRAESGRASARRARDTDSDEIADRKSSRRPRGTAGRDPLREAAADDAQVIQPQPGPQRLFATTTADIAIYGGAWWGGKTFALLLEPLRHVENARFGAVIIRRKFTQITQEGGIWDEAMNLYPAVGGRPNRNTLEFRWPSGARIGMAHCQHETDLENFKGAQIPLPLIDQLEQFTGKMFWFLLGRNRSTCGVRPYLRATCNPVPDGWLRELVDWWIDRESGYPIKARAGQLRYFVRRGNKLIWSSSRQGMIREHGLTAEERKYIKSLTFIPARYEDNKIGMQLDPTYVANIMALEGIEKERALGNWNVRETEPFLRREWFQVVAEAPQELRWVRAWDLAITAKQSSDRTASVECAFDSLANFYIRRGIAGKWEYPEAKRVMKQAMLADPSIEQVIPRALHELAVMQDLQRDGDLLNVTITADDMAKRPSRERDKVSLARPLQARAHAGMVYVVAEEGRDNAWVQDYIAELCAFTTDDTHEYDDYLDATTTGYRNLGAPQTLELLEDHRRGEDAFDFIYPRRR